MAIWHWPRRAAYTAETPIGLGICDLVGNWPGWSAALPDGCDGISNRPEIVRAGFGLINREQVGGRCCV